MTATLVLAVPSKGRLQEQSAEFFADCSLDYEIEAGARGYAARMPAARNIEVRLMSAGEIARALVRGDVHVGVVGEDGLREADPRLARTILVKPLGFGRCDLVLAAPQSWLDVASMADFAEVAAAHRARTGARLRVATKYLNQAQAFLDASGVADYRLVESAGATEGAPAAGAAEAIIDITTSGATLAANGLAPVPGGLILRSQAQLAASRSADWSAGAHEAFARALDVIEARHRARAVRLLRVAAGPGGPEPMIERAAALGCKLAGASEGALLELYCPVEQVFAACAALQGLIGGAIGVFTPDFVFEQPNRTHEAFVEALS